MERKHNSKLTPFAKELRRNMTKEERNLWYDFLKNYPVRFSRQKIPGKYIVDFYSAQAKIIMERTDFLAGYGLTVLRIPNNEVMGNFLGVCEYIDTAVKQSLSQLR